jgi:multidrug transporter EmrE-like cation transporter
VGIFLVALLSYGFFGEVLRWQALVGLVFIVIGVTMVNYFSDPTSQ